MGWHIIIDTDSQEKIAIKYAALQESIPVKEWIKNTLLDACPKEVENGTMTEDSFSPCSVRIIDM